MIIKILKNIFFKLTGKKSIENIDRNIAYLVTKNLLKQNKFQNKKNLMKYGYKVFSQQDEDGIIDEIFKRIGCGSKKFVEMGLETGIECNTANLLFQNWSGLWIESSQKSVFEIKKNYSNFLNKSLEVYCEKITTKNVNEILLKFYKEETEIDLLSIDISTHTYHVLEVIKSITPRVIVVEYNAKYGPTINWTIDYNQNSEWDHSDYFGGSLKAFQIMLNKKGYVLVGCNVTGVNAFFVRKDQIEDKFESDTSSEYHFVEGRYWLKRAFDKNYKIRLK
jgi:hypothetical protein